MSIREARPEDAARLGVVHVQCWRESYLDVLSQQLLDSIRPEDRATRWDQIIGSPNDQQWVAEVDGEIVGFAGTGAGRDDDAPGELELYAIYVLTAHHGTGAGQALLDAAIGTKPAFLWIATDNARAEAFYRRNGFEFDGVTTVAPFFGEMLRESRMFRQAQRLGPRRI
ncbi:MAG: GNAT family N-acetyltransferase [Cryobacterium sp.]